MEEKLRKKAEKKGIKVGSKVIIDGDTTHVYRVRDMFIGEGLIRAYLSSGGIEISWNADSPRLTVYEELITND